MLLAGCADASPGMLHPTWALEQLTPTPTATLTPAPRVTSPPVAIPASPTPAADTVIATARNLVGLAIADLAGALNTGAAEITVRLVEAVEWPGGRLDCEPGAGGDEERSPGYRITLDYRNTPYVYHMNLQGEYVRCPAEAVTPSGEPVILDTQVSALVELARQNLAQRLDLPVRRVFVVDAYPMAWPDARLGCIGGEERVPPTPVSGYRIVLRVGEAIYVYHSDYRQVIFCPVEATPPSATLQAVVTATPPEQG